jgi:ligand-binding sensor domain-containing protein/two-component sensor histidine kinase
LKKSLLLFSIVFQVLTGYGQQRIGDFMAYGNNDGLPAALFYSVYQSSDGYLWMGSSSGLVRFDGKRYKIFFSDYANPNSISDNIIVDLAEDKEHNLWMAGLFQGLTKLNLRTGLIQRYSRLSEDKTPGYGINKILVDNEGQIWVATSGRGLAHYVSAQDSFEFYIPDPLQPNDGSVREANHISDLAIDISDQNIFWLSCFDGLYSFHRKQKKFEHFVTPNPEAKDSPLPFLSVASDSGHLLWLGTWYNGLMSFNSSTNQFIAYPYSLADPSNSSHYQALDVKSINDSILYIAARNSGLLSFDKRTHQIQPLLTNAMLPGGSSDLDIQRISITPDAGVFIGGNYYIYQQHKAFNRFSKAVIFPYGSHFSVHQVVYDDLRKGYWIACYNAGQIIFLSQDFITKKLYQPGGIEDNQFLDVAIDRNHDVWVITLASGLLKIGSAEKSPGRVGYENPGLDTLAGDIICVDSDEKGNLWLLSRRQLYYLDVSTNVLRSFQLLNDNQVSLYELDLCTGLQQDAWVASNYGLFHARLDQNKVIHLLPDAETHEGIANLLIKTLTVDQSGNAWLGFESDGVQVVSGVDHSILSSYNLDDGLPGMQINCMVTDTAGKIWVGTSAGLAVFDPKAETSIWQLFNREDGITRDFIDRPIMATKDGRLFFNIDEGLSWIDIGTEEGSKGQVPILHLIALQVDGKPYREDLLPDYLTSVELSYATKEIRIEYAAMDWLHSGRTKYFYKIEGINSSDDWIENKLATLLLTNMKPGKFLLRLYAVSGDGIQSKEIKLPILIRPPFWQRWWFISFCVLSVLLIGYAIYQYRIGQLKKMQAMRNTISTNLHDDIGASLSNIHILTVLTQRNMTNTENATSYITKAGDEIQRISESLSDIVWNINPKFDDLDHLFIRMKRYAADMLEGKNIKAELIFPEAIEKLSMPMDQRRDFYLIFKEAVNNLVKYSEAEEAQIKVSIDHPFIRLEVEDNGQGFDELTLRYGNGLQNMKQRADKWRAILQVKSRPGQGTSISLDMKMN